MIDLILGDFLPYIIAGFGALASVVVAYLKGRSSANAKRDADEMQNAYKNERLRDEIDNRNDGPDARDSLRDKWGRD